MEVIYHYRKKTTFFKKKVVILLYYILWKTTRVVFVILHTYNTHATPAVQDIEIAEDFVPTFKRIVEIFTNIIFR